MTWRLCCCIDHSPQFSVCSEIAWRQIGARPWPDNATEIILTRTHKTQLHFSSLYFDSNISFFDRKHVTGWLPSAKFTLAKVTDVLVNRWQYLYDETRQTKRASRWAVWNLKFNVWSDVRLATSLAVERVEPYTEGQFRAVWIAVECVTSGRVLHVFWFVHFFGLCKTLFGWFFL